MKLYLFLSICILSYLAGFMIGHENQELIVTPPKLEIKSPSNIITLEPESGWKNRL